MLLHVSRTLAAGSSKNQHQRSVSRHAVRRCSNNCKALLVPVPCIGSVRSSSLPFAAAKTIKRPGRQQLQCKAAQVVFEVVQETQWGETMRLIGGAPAMGAWNPDKAAVMEWSDGHVWKATLELPAEKEVEFKLIKAGDQEVIWEGGNNRKLQVPSSGNNVIRMSWDRTSEALGPGKPFSTPVGMSEEGRRDRYNAPQELTDVLGSLSSDRIETNQWQGKQVQFMRSNEHSGDRHGRWDTSGLEGAALALVKGDEKSPNWLNKLSTVKRVLVDESVDKKPDKDALAYAYIYMQWIATGAIACAEGGGHYRPNHHAELAQVMFRSLEWVIAENNEASFVARKLELKLPSFSDEFRASTPLTRIRDIAHRNDIPHELKQEIKHTLQNKLHRNAGPEDLVATEVMMERLIRDAPHRGYPDAFLKEFAIFLGELREFFSAGKLEDMLRQLQPSLDDAGLQVVDSFLASKQRLDNGDDSPNTLMEVFHSVTTVRALLASGLSSGLRNDAPDSALLMRQRWRLSEGKCAEYSFTLMSRFINQLEHKGGAGFLSQAPDREWNLPLGAAVLGVRHLGLSGWDPSECMALENELAAWQRQAGFTKHDNALRLKATLERVQFLTQAYSDWELTMFSDRAMKLGHALGLPAERVNVFTEAEIRASVVFQLSKLATLLLKSLRLAVGAAAWDCIVAGESVGKLVSVTCIDPATVPGPSEGPLILLVKEANGDEEVAAVGPHLRGVILCQALPHLSHLGVRARQERVPFVTCDDEELLQGVVHPLVNKTVRLTAGTEGVKLEEARASEAAAVPAYANNGNGAVAATSGRVDKVSSPTVLPLSAAEPSTSGAKSASCAELARLESKAGSFRTPAGCVLPFGTMELAVKAAGLEAEFTQLLNAIEKADLTSLDRLCGDMQELIMRVQPDSSTLRNIRSAFDGVSSVIVRSSSNVEDLAGMSGAGLYESIANVPVKDEAALSKAISEVWASLYTRRAVLSRRTAGVPQSEATMAILIMEMLAADISFVLHTVSPLDQDDNVLYAELAVGQGETLASGTKGSAWRLSVDKQSGAVTVHSFANFSRAFVPGGGPSGGAAQESGSATAVATKPGTMTVDYSKHALSNDASVREEIAKRLTGVGSTLEQEFGCAQDVEGCFIGKELYIVQTRPQP